MMPTFTVIDNLTGKEADEYTIAKTEDWAKGLMWMDIEGFALEDDGTLLLVDECGGVAYCPEERFSVVFNGGAVKGDKMTLVIHGKPAPQPRVRAYRRGEHAGVYTPSTADAWKGQVILAAGLYRGQFTTGALRLEVEFYLPRPQAHKHDDYVAVKPDLDNLLKSTMDALTNAGVWHDDAQVAAVVMSKRYKQANHTVGAVIRLEAL